MTRLRLELVLLLSFAACSKTASSPTEHQAADPPADSSAPAEASPATVQAQQPEPPEDPKAAQLYYHEVMLGGAQPTDEVPMIIAIHGLGDRPRGFMHLFNGFPEKARLILPQAIDPYEDGGFSWFPIKARDGDTEGLAKGIAHAGDLLAEAIAELAKTKPTSGSPVVTGFSQGGMLTFVLAVHHPDVVGAAVPVSGWLPPPLWPEKKKRGADYPPIFALHGTADNAVAFEPSKQALDHLDKLGFRTQLRAYDGVMHVITDEMRRDLFDQLAQAVRAQEKRP